MAPVSTPYAVGRYRGVWPRRTYHTHLFRETSETTARTYCGLGERYDFWEDATDGGVTCAVCLAHCERTKREPSSE